MTNDEAPTTDSGSYLRAARRAANLTQPELAEQSGVGVRTISLLETGRHSNVRAGTLSKLARALGIDEHDLITAFVGGTAPSTPKISGAPLARSDRAQVSLPVDALTSVFNAISSFLAVDDSPTARDRVAAAAGELFTAYAIALLERAAAHDGEQHGYLVSLIKMQVPAFPDTSEERNYLNWLLGIDEDFTESDRQRYELRWRTSSN
ncbi:helix-turn-helix transcriptional regulator [Gordonia rubripertincta]|uniref:helix-turn-helix domain-containing protein n=1 Tax=Gordonia rubripertincta TaxID=36822 RepID=UPI00117CCDF7|nr:helix-turn-helix transcriptional regulator [Gordonia rubripertincta]TSD93468.1 helix-turn-helix transcriptional regulator [Gordonia rubripertincta]